MLRQMHKQHSFDGHYPLDKGFDIRSSSDELAPPGGMSNVMEVMTFLEPPTISRTPRNVMHYNCLAFAGKQNDNRLSLYQLSHGGMVRVGETPRLQY